MFSAAIANNGTLMTPYLVQKVMAPDLTPLVTAQPSVLSQAVSPGVASQVSQMMVNVVKQPYGTAHNSVTSLTSIPIAAKTGTAQNGSNNTGLDDAVFTCFAPAANPQIAVGVIVKGAVWAPTRPRRSRCKSSRHTWPRRRSDDHGRQAESEQRTAGRRAPPGTTRAPGWHLTPAHG